MPCLLPTPVTLVTEWRPLRAAVTCAIISARVCIGTLLALP